jgi:hypothetical protein
VLLADVEAGGVLTHDTPVAVGLDPPLEEMAVQLGPRVHTEALHLAVQSAHDVTPVIASESPVWHEQEQLNVDEDELLPLV